MKNIILIGMPGCGKSVIGKKVAKQLNIPIFDIDKLIEEKTGCQVSKIFNSLGEEQFRILENEMINEVSENKNCVISTGGGVVLNTDNMKVLKRNGIIVFINRSIDVIAQSVRTENRPILKGKSGAIYSLYKKRLPLYKKYCDIEIKNNRPMGQVVNDIISKVSAVLMEEQRMNISVDTKILGVIGSPIAHSLSPKIFNLLMIKYGKNGVYFPFSVGTGCLNKFINSVKALNISAFNVTMPHKEYIIPFIDEMTEDAKLYNSVNCVKNINGKLIGHNTDSSGVLMSLEDMGINIKNEKVIVLGGGGAAKALSIGLSKAGAKEVVVINRTLKKAQDICTCGNMRACGLTMENLKNELRESVLMINGTPMGMKGGNAQFDGFSFLDETKAFIYDTVYYPRRTRLLEEAGKRGLKAASGLTMLVYQGLFAYEFFFNEKIDIKKEAAWLINKI